MEPEPPFFAWSRSQPNLVGPGANRIWSKPESAPGPRTSEAGASTNSFLKLQLILPYYRRR